MDHKRDLAVPWVPLPDIPQSPCGIEVDAAPGWVTVRAVYSFYGGDRDLIIEMRSLVASLFDEAASPLVDFSRGYPKLTDPRWPRHWWPLMKVENSSWLVENRARLFEGIAYEHIRIVSDDGTFDAIVEQAPDNVQWVPGKGASFYTPSYRSK